MKISPRLPIALVLTLIVSAVCEPAARAQTDVVYPANAGLYNVKNFGAKGDGVTDDTAAFQTAIKNALDQSALMIGTTDWWSIDTANGNAVLHNGVSTGHVDTALFNNGGTLLAVNAAGQWESYDGTTWTTINPTTVGGEAVRPRGATGSLTISGATWTIASSGVISRNGVSTGVTGQSLFNDNGTPVYISSTGAWSYWDGGAWQTLNPTFMGSANLLSRIHNTGAHYGAMVILYIPNGTYILSDTLRSNDTTGTSSGWVAGMYLQGQSQAGTILKLADSAAGFSTVATPKPMVQTGSETTSGAPAGQGNKAFRHYIRNLTVDVGTGHSGAIGIDFLVSNRGGIFNVTVRSSDPGLAGFAGLSMERDWPGPGMVKNVTINGFTTGVSMTTQFEYNMVFENLTLNHQVTGGYGMNIAKNGVSIHGLTSNNTVPVINTTSANAHVNVLDGEFTGGAAANTAIQGTGTVYCRNLTSSGYGTVVGTYAGGAGKTSVAEYVYPTLYKGFADDISGSIALPVEPTPDFNSTTSSQWVNASLAAASVNGDWLPAIQAAIDAGKPVVYLPQGTYTVSDTIVLRGAVQKFIGCCAAITASAAFPPGHPMFRFDGGTAAYMDIQNIRCNPVTGQTYGNEISHNASQTLVLENCDLGPYSNTAAGVGDLFMEDLISGAVNISAQYAWARQLNVEKQTTTFVKNTGGILWLFGYKTEENASTAGTLLDSESNAWTELLGGFFYNLSGSAPPSPMILNDNSSLSASYVMDPDGNSPKYTVNIQDTEGGSTANLTQVRVALYSGAPQTYAAATLNLAGQNIGAVPTPGSASLSGSTYTVSGSGNVTGTADALYLASQSVSGNFDVIARLTSQSGVNAVRGAVTVRDSAAADAMQVYMAVAPAAGWTIRYRTATGAADGGKTGGGSSDAPLPFWLRINRTGNVFTTYVSPDGVVWAATDTLTIPMGSTVLAGLGVDSGGGTALNTCTFDNVSVQAAP